MKKRVFVFIVVMVLCLSILGGCVLDKTGMVYEENDLMKGITVGAELTDGEVDTWMNSSEQSEDMRKSANEFAVSLFKEGLADAGGENLLVSPISVLYAMSMCANGADEMTRVELLQALATGKYTGEIKCGTRETPGEGDIYDELQEKLNGYLGSYLKAIANYEGDPEKKAELNIANSIWVRNDEKLVVEKDFLETNGKYYNAGVFKSDFDEAARKEINSWIEEHTGGLIKDMLKSLSDDAIMYLVNALSFEAEWAEIYEDYQVSDDVFYGENGEATVSFMYGEEYGYLNDGKAQGFIKPYAGYDYAFVGLLPNEGITVDEYINGLTGEGLYEMLVNQSDEKVLTSIPQFENESAMSLVDAFKRMGVNEAFDIENANFTRMGSYEDKNIAIGNILHNTYIKVDQLGTKAGAATVVEMLAGAALDPEPPKEVYLNRPFVYMIIDTNQNLPLFIGVERNI